MKKLIVILFVPILLFSCEKELDLKGTIKGAVELSIWNERDKPAEGARVILTDGVRHKEVVADGQGIFRFHNIDEGYYSLSFSYDGYGTYNMPDFVYTGLGKDLVVKNTLLRPIPEFDAQEVQLKLTSGVKNYTVIEGFITCRLGQSEYVNIALFFDKNPEVSTDNHTYSTFDSNINRVQGDTIFVKDLVSDLKKGEKWYISICVYNYSDYSPPTTLKEIYNTLELIVQ